MADLLSVQRSLDGDFSAARVDGELLQRIPAHDGVSQQVVDRTVLIRGRYLEPREVVEEFVRESRQKVRATQHGSSAQ